MEHCSNPPAFTGVRARKLVQITTIQSIHQFPHVQNQVPPSFYLSRNPFTRIYVKIANHSLCFMPTLRVRGLFQFTLLF